MAEKVHNIGRETVQTLWENKTKALSAAAIGFVALEVANHIAHWPKNNSFRRQLPEVTPDTEHPQETEVE